MGLNELATYSTRVQKRSIFLWRWMKSFLGVTRKLRSLKTKLIENSEDYPEHRCSSSNPGQMADLLPIAFNFGGGLLFP